MTTYSHGTFFAHEILNTVNPTFSHDKISGIVRPYDGHPSSFCQLAFLFECQRRCHARARFGHRIQAGQSLEISPFSANADAHERPHGSDSEHAGPAFGSLKRRDSGNSKSANPLKSNELADFFLPGFMAGQIRFFPSSRRRNPSATASRYG